MNKDSFGREIKVGDLVVWSTDWGASICVIRGFGKTGNPLFAMVDVLDGDQIVKKYNAHMSSSRNTIFKLELDWLYVILDQRRIMELMKVRMEIMEGTYK